MSRWSALHVHLHGGPDQADALLRDHVVPATAASLDRGEISSWFFVRYWEGGPHLRWRVADASPATAHRLRAGLVEAVAALPPPAREPRPADWYARFGVAATDDLGWHPHGTVLAEPYEPETDRYGGPEAIAAAEDLFAASSRVAATVLGAAPARRRSTAVDLLFAFVTASGFSGHAAAGFLRGYANGWAATPAADGAGLAEAVTTAERDFHARPAAFVERQRQVAGIVAGRTGAGTSVGFWADAVAGYVARLRELAGQGRLTAPVPAILASQIHMLHNRLGLSIPAECQLAWLASATYARPVPPPDLHADGPDARDRAYHEGSKFVRPLWPAQRPRAAAAPGPAGAAPAAEVLPLPAATAGPLGTTTLADALLARRTRGDLGSEAVDAAQLSRLLRYAAGTTGDARLAYPTAGGLASARLTVLPRRTDGVPPALYRYLPERHALHRVAPDPGPDRLARVAPQFDPAAPAGIDAAAVALWLFVVVDLTRSRAKYGSRAYRFAAVETGHLAQNLLLATTALGLRATPVGGFFDDYLDHLLLLDGVSTLSSYVLAVGSGD